MSPTDEQITSRMEELLGRFSGDAASIGGEELIAWGNNILNLLRATLSFDSPQLKILEDSFTTILEEDNLLYGDPKSIFFMTVRGILAGTHSDFQQGFIKNLRAEIRGEVDADFLAQAIRLLNDELKDPAAMLIGAVLEDSLRQLCLKHEVTEGLNIESMNIPLKRAGIYNLPVQQQVTAWAAIRNKADHGHFNEYDLLQVKNMHQGVLDFIVKFL